MWTEWATQNLGNGWKVSVHGDKEDGCHQKGSNSLMQSVLNGMWTITYGKEGLESCWSSRRHTTTQWCQENNTKCWGIGWERKEEQKTCSPRKDVRDWRPLGSSGVWNSIPTKPKKKPKKKYQEQGIFIVVVMWPFVFFGDDDVCRCYVVENKWK